MSGPLTWDPTHSGCPFTATLSHLAQHSWPVHSSAEGWPPVLLEAPGLETVEVSGAHDKSPRGRVYEMRGCFSLATFDSIFKVPWQAKRAALQGCLRMGKSPRPVDQRPPVRAITCSRKSSYTLTFVPTPALVGILTEPESIGLRGPCTEFTVRFSPRGTSRSLFSVALGLSSAALVKG